MLRLTPFFAGKNLQAFKALCHLQEEVSCQRSLRALCLLECLRRSKVRKQANCSRSLHQQPLPCERSCRCSTPFACPFLDN